MRHLLPLSLLLTTACAAVVGSGVPATESREVGAFEGVRNASSLDVRVSVGETGPVVLTCDDNLIDEVITEVDAEGLLVIRVRDGLWFDTSADCRADVPAPTLRAVENLGSGDLWVRDALDVAHALNAGSGDLILVGEAMPLAHAHNAGSGDLDAIGIDVAELQLSNNGSGDVVVVGEAAVAVLGSTGSGDLDAGELRVGEATLNHTGSGEVSLWVTGHAEITLTGSGDVVVAGGAAIEAHVSGSGEIVRQ